jgi:hypothetical protein
MAVGKAVLYFRFALLTACIYTILYGAHVFGRAGEHIEIALACTLGLLIGLSASFCFYFFVTLRTELRRTPPN